MLSGMLKEKSLYIYTCACWWYQRKFSQVCIFPWKYINNRISFETVNLNNFLRHFSIWLKQHLLDLRIGYSIQMMKLTQVGFFLILIFINRNRIFIPTNMGSRFVRAFFKLWQWHYTSLFDFNFEESTICRHNSFYVGKYR